MAPFGYAGKILRVDLSSGSMAEVSTLDYADRFLGGWGLAAKIYWDEVLPAEAGHPKGRWEMKKHWKVAIACFFGLGHVSDTLLGLRRGRTRIADYYHRRNHGSYRAELAGVYSHAPCHGGSGQVLQ